MSRTRVALLSLIVDGSPEDVDLAVYEDGEMALHLGHGVTLNLEQASVELLRAVSDAFDQAAELKDQAGIVALNTPALPDATIHTLRGPDYGTGQAS